MDSYTKAFKNYAVFSGRTTRKDYWMFVLINFLVSVAIQSIFPSTQFGGNVNNQINILASLYSLAVFIPGLAILFRRLHDTGRSGWWILISLIPIAGWITIIVFAALKSEDKDNEYGPKQVGQTVPPQAPTTPEQKA